MRTLRRRTFENARAQPLAAHFHETEVADAAKLNARAVEAQRVLEAAFHGTVVPLLFHVDEVDDDEAREVAELQLARNFIGCFEVRVVGRLLDRELARSLARV